MDAVFLVLLATSTEVKLFTSFTRQFEVRNLHMASRVLRPVLFGDVTRPDYQFF